MLERSLGVLDRFTWIVRYWGFEGGTWSAVFGITMRDRHGLILLKFLFSECSSGIDGTVSLGPRVRHDMTRDRTAVLFSDHDTG